VIARVVMMTLVAVMAFLTQTVVLPAFAVLGWRPDLMLLTVIGFALAGGPQTGLRYGFAAGLLLDLASGTNQLVGLSSLILLSAGWATGQVRPYLTTSPLGGQMAVGGLVTAVVLLLRGLLEMLLDIGQYSPFVLLQGVLVTGLYNAVLVPVVCGPLHSLVTHFTKDPLAT
jgi:rod shape-determining protein MreD